VRENFWIFTSKTIPRCFNYIFDYFVGGQQCRIATDSLQIKIFSLLAMDLVAVQMYNIKKGFYLW